MKKERNQKILSIGISMLVIFVLWTVLIKYIDVQAIGPRNSYVGFAEFNGFVHNLTGVHMKLYHITDWLGLVPILFIFGFGLFGLTQLIQRKSILKVDSDILLLGGFYIVLMLVYVLFEYVVINRRPVLIDGFLEVSYPSSTTLLVLCVMPTAVIELNRRIKHIKFRVTVSCIINAFTVFMVISRLISGVHWVTDIIGGIMFSTGLVMVCYSMMN